MKNKEILKEAFKDFKMDADSEITFQIGLSVRKDLEPRYIEFQKRSKNGFSKALRRLVELAIEYTEI